MNPAPVSHIERNVEEMLTSFIEVDVFRILTNCRISENCTVRSEISVRLRNLVIFEVFGVEFSAKK